MSKSPDAFRTISEVAEWLEVQAHVLRFWESKFPQVKPVKRAGGRRYYRPADMQFLGGIQHLLHEDGLSIKDVQAVIREHGAAHVQELSKPLDDDDLVPAEAAPVSKWADPTPPAETTPPNPARREKDPERASTVSTHVPATPPPFEPPLHEPVQSETATSQSTAVSPEDTPAAAPLPTPSQAPAELDVPGEPHPESAATPDDPVGQISMPLDLPAAEPHRPDDKAGPQTPPAATAPPGPDMAQDAPGLEGQAEGQADFFAPPAADTTPTEDVAPSGAAETESESQIAAEQDPGASPQMPLSESPQAAHQEPPTDMLAPAVPEDEAPNAMQRAIASLATPPVSPPEEDAPEPSQPPMEEAASTEPPLAELSPDAQVSKDPETTEPALEPQADLAETAPADPLQAALAPEAAPVSEADAETQSTAPISPAESPADITPDLTQDSDAAPTEQMSELPEPAAPAPDLSTIAETPLESPALDTSSEALSEPEEEHSTASEVVPDDAAANLDDMEELSVADAAPDLPDAPSDEAEPEATAVDTPEMIAPVEEDPAAAHETADTLMDAAEPLYETAEEPIPEAQVSTDEATPPEDLPIIEPAPEPTAAITDTAALLSPAPTPESEPMAEPDPSDAEIAEDEDIPAEPLATAPSQPPSLAADSAETASGDPEDLPSDDAAEPPLVAQSAQAETPTEAAAELRPLVIETSDDVDHVILTGPLSLLAHLSSLPPAHVAELAALAQKLQELSAKH